MIAVENDCEEVGFTSMADGCFACPPLRWEGGQPVRPAIVQRGQWMCCERCGGSYGPAPSSTHKEPSHG